MRQHKILIRAILVLSIISFALAAPVAVRGRPEVRLDANVTRNVTAASRERRGSDESDEGESTNPDHAPPPSPLSDILSQIAYADTPPPTPEHSGLLTGSDYVPGFSPHHSQPGPSTQPPSPLTDILSQKAYGDSLPPTPDAPGSYLPLSPDLPVAGSLSPPPPSPHHSQPGESAPPPSPLTDFLSQEAYTDRPSPIPDNPGALTGWDYVPPSPGSPTGPSEDRFPSPSGSSVNPDTLSATGPTGNQPTEGLGMDSDMHHLLNPEPFPTEFWDKVLKGKFKCRIYGSDVVNVAQKDTRSRIF